MNKKRLKILEFSDVHLGHHKCTTNHILDNLTKYIINYNKLGDVDIVFIAGDFFDRLLSLPDPNVDSIKFWINRFLMRCKELDITLRVLEGTPSHDWKQSKQFTSINERSGIECDVKFIDNLSIEYIEKFDIHVLYIPDEWRPETDDIWLDVQSALTEKGIDQVDFSVMHGAFSYQLPSHISAPTHLEERYLSITKEYIFIGHVHKPSVHDRIISAGSFDRLSHNEEEDKGVVVVEINGDERNIEFIPNESAMVFKTIKCDDLDLTTTLKAIKKQVQKLPLGSHVRISAHESNPILSNIDSLRDIYPNIFFTSKRETSVDVPKELNIDIDTDYEPVHITKNNLNELMEKRMAAVDPVIKNRAMTLLKDHI